MMKGLRAFWACPLILLLLSLSGCLDLSEARHHNQKDPSAVVVGTVYCDTCFQDDFSKASHFISGATVAVECAQGNSRPAFYQEVKTDKQGKFKVHLPFMVSKHVKEIEGCTVKLVKSSEPYCAVASTASSSAIHLKEKTRGKHVFSAGFFTFKPLKQPGLCSQKPSVTKSNLNSFQGLLPDPGLPTIPNLNPIPNPLTPTGPDLPLMPPLPGLPKLPTLPPLPPLPPLPGLPGIPFFNTIPQKPVVPSEEKRVRNEEVAQPQFFFPPVISPPSTGLPLPPNPLQPPPLVPNPFQPPPGPLIPNPFQPPSPPPSFLPPVPPLPNLPPIPGVTPTPSPPPAAPTFPLPPLSPLIPGVPPVVPGIPIPPIVPGIPVPPVVPGIPVPPVVPGIPIPPVVPGIPMPPASANPKKATP